METGTPATMAIIDAADAAATVIGDDDILTEILLRLPIKSIIRSKSVSKQWRSLIAGLHFSLLHTLRHPTTASTAIFLRQSPSRFYHIPLIRGNSNTDPHLKVISNFNYSIIQSCNGLFLCKYLNCLDNCIVYNPTTGQCKALDLDPDPPILGLSLAFDPRKSPHYKVICVRTTISNVFCYQIEVFDSNSQVWNLSGKPFAAPHDVRFCDGVFWNGGIHWIRPKGDSLYYNVEKESIEHFPGIPAPSWRWQYPGRYSCFFGESNGHLHFSTLYGSKVLVFEMDKDYSRWCMSFGVDFDCISAFVGVTYCQMFRLLGVVRGDNEEESLLVFHVPGKVVAYKFSDNSFEELADLRREQYYREDCLQFGYSDARLFIPTLAPV